MDSPTNGLAESMILTWRTLFPDGLTPWTSGLYSIHLFLLRPFRRIIVTPRLSNLTVRVRQSSIPFTNERRMNGRKTSGRLGNRTCCRRRTTPLRSRQSNRNGPVQILRNPVFSVGLRVAFWFFRVTVLIQVTFRRNLVEAVTRTWFRP